MSKTALEKRKPAAIKEKAQYAAAFGIIGVMLFVAGFPVFLLFFVGVLTFFIWKVFSAEGRNETRRIFEFYLSANEILREDDRRWYGFEIQETIARGENILRSMSAAPPLLSFTLGALYQKIDDHSSAVKHLSQVVGDDSAKETSIVYPTRELRDYVKMLRKIERSPAEAPLTSSAIRALERARRNRGVKLLDHSRIELAKQVVPVEQTERRLESIVEAEILDAKAPNTPPETRLADIVEDVHPVFVSHQPPPPPRQSVTSIGHNGAREKDRKTISEVLHDIYDKGVQ